VPFTAGLQRKLDERVATAQNARLGDQLHEVVNQLRFLDSVEPPSSDRMQSIVNGCESVWNERFRILRAAESVDDQEFLERVRRDLLDLAILWSDLRVRLAEPPQVAAARDVALQILSDAESLVGSSTVLTHERGRHSLALGRADAAPQADDDRPLSTWDNFALGRAKLRENDAATAAKYLDKAIELEPDAFWPHFHRGVCAYRLGQFDEAVTEFSVCVALGPDYPACVENLRLAKLASQKK
jgi:tetratricopeptide (TPR) repeat protein